MLFDETSIETRRSLRWDRLGEDGIAEGPPVGKGDHQPASHEEGQEKGREGDDEEGSAST
jgi:hypothetical protein